MGNEDTVKRPVLKVGAKGDDVTELQVQLTAVGCSPGASDGMFGPATDRAVRSLQEAMGLTVDGVAGHAVWTALEALPNLGADTPLRHRNPLNPWQRRTEPCVVGEPPREL